MPSAWMTYPSRPYWYSLPGGCTIWCILHTRRVALGRRVLPALRGHVLREELPCLLSSSLSSHPIMFGFVGPSHQRIEQRCNLPGSDSLPKKIIQFFFT